MEEQLMTLDVPKAARRHGWEHKIFVLDFTL